MKCSKVRKYLYKFIDNSLPDKLKSEVDKHLKECYQCNKEYNKILKLQKMINTYFQDEEVKYNNNIEVEVYEKILEKNNNFAKIKYFLLKPLVIATTFLLIFFIGITSINYYKNFNDKKKLESLILKDQNIVDFLTLNNITEIMEFYYDDYIRDDNNSEQIFESFYNTLYFYLEIKYKDKINRLDYKDIEEVLIHTTEYYYNYFKDNYNDILL